MKFAIIVVDMQQDFFLNEVLAAQQQRLIEKTNELVSLAREKRHSVIWVRQEFSPNLSDAPLEVRRLGLKLTIKGTTGASLAEGLVVSPNDMHVIKKRYSAFFDTDLDKHLRTMDCNSIIVSGINSHACVRMTVIDAYQRDKQVIMARECIASHDPAHHEVTWNYLDGKLAQGMTNEEIRAIL